jgi:hypothetical protein
MSQDESKRIGNHDEATDEVEGHVVRAGVNDEAATEGESDDDVEAHVKRAGHARKQ